MCTQTNSLRQLAQNGCALLIQQMQIMYDSEDTHCLNQSPYNICMTNIPSNFLKSVHTNFLCATFYQHSSIFRMPCMKYMQTHFLKENLCAFQSFLVCALISRPVRARTCAKLRGNIVFDLFPACLKFWIYNNKCSVLKINNYFYNSGWLLHSCRSLKIRLLLAYHHSFQIRLDGIRWD